MDPWPGVMRTNVALDTWALCRFSLQRAAHADEQ